MADAVRQPIGALHPHRRLSFLKGIYGAQGAYGPQADDAATLLHGLPLGAQRATAARGLVVRVQSGHPGQKLQFESVAACESRQALFALLRGCTNLRWCNIT
jgi:hypothetical protein